MLRFNASYHQLPLSFNPDEIEEAAWISLSKLRDTFLGLKSSFVPGYHIHLANQAHFDEPTDFISTDALFPLYRFNPLRQGLGKGHYLALRYLLR